MIEERDRTGTDPAVRKAYDDADQQWWDNLKEAIKVGNLELNDVLKYFPAFIRRRDLPVVLARYELFKLIEDMPGCIVELGVQHGAGFFLWSKLMETFCPGARARMVYGFESFSGLQNFHEKDGRQTEWLGKRTGGMKADAEMVRRLVELNTQDNFLKGIPRCQLIEGDVCETLEKFLVKNTGMRIALLYFDMDLYKPTLYALEKLYPYVIEGGIVVFDEYGGMPWEGESKAVEEFFANFDKKPVMKNFPWSQSPTAYFIKQ